MKLSDLWSAAKETVTPPALTCANPTTCPLSRVKAGAEVRIKELSAPDDVSKRLREIGFCEQQVLKLLVSQSSLICLVCNARVALSSDLAQMIMVEPVRARVGKLERLR
jgi:Fe2+ transport system protein FeoA